jgi:predicted nucleic acid-binding protein
MNLVDSSAWLEYFSDGSNAAFFAPAIEDIDSLVVPVVCVYEVFKQVLQKQGLSMAELRVADMYKGKLVDLTAPLALSAAKISADTKLPMADSFILATARAYQAVVWTQDEHFKDIEGVQFIGKSSLIG